MGISRTVIAGVLAATLTVAGCSKNPPPSTAGSAASGSGSAGSSATAHGSAPAQPTDYAGWLIRAEDINAPETFTASPPTNNPNGQPGVATTFSTQDGSHVIHDTIQVLADPDAAVNALNAAKADHAKGLKAPATKPAKIGTGGTTLEGDALDGSKGVTFLMFTEGRAFVTLEFDGPVFALAPSDFVNDVGLKQDAAVKKGLGG
ncbi:hypothetical protein [Mycobacterium sp.]|uniref:hypothetical protein n=1 Tax=Mycobacterium sp. TaxID=1785 RepID=UPI002B5B9ECB|nr:hypothetical protein [Mycobacterium sp.]HTQ22607.1 hypothetical protein [Mycobacterium sp.]